METQHEQQRAGVKAGEVPVPTPTQAENDAAMIAATGGDAAPDVPPPEGATRSEQKPASHAEQERHDRQVPRR